MTDKKEQELVAALRKLERLWPKSGYFLAVVGEQSVMLIRETGRDPVAEDIVAEFDKIVGTYVLKPNFPGLGSHVVNGGYMVHPDFQGKGIGTEILLHSLQQAKRMNFMAMQFNLVVATNIRAVELYERHGFKIVGQLPKAFNHIKLGFVDAYVMHRFL